MLFFLHNSRYDLYIPGESAVRSRACTHPAQRGVHDGDGTCEYILFSVKISRIKFSRSWLIHENSENFSP